MMKRESLHKSMKEGEIELSVLARGNILQERVSPWQWNEDLLARRTVIHVNETRIDTTTNMHPAVRRTVTVRSGSRLGGRIRPTVSILFLERMYVFLCESCPSVCLSVSSELLHSQNVDGLFLNLPSYVLFVVENETNFISIRFEF
jgi:hypothetical protein